MYNLLIVSLLCIVVFLLICSLVIVLLVFAVSKSCNVELEFLRENVKNGITFKREKKKQAKNKNGINSSISDLYFTTEEDYAVEEEAYAPDDNKAEQAHQEYTRILKELEAKEVKGW